MVHLSGNDNDKAKLRELLSNFKKQLNLDSIFIADSPLYSQDNLFLIRDLKWITRVPLLIKTTQLYVREIPESQFIKINLIRNKYFSIFYDRSNKINCF